ncbi:MAG: hypothetical protein H6985_12875 [Pseudomonadales bacterium]|nr:hypothetical protein [Halioglobus sp.]MCP5130465.1 hypothetical protein [Pseudomonadales bacterium]
MNDAESRKKSTYGWFSKLCIFIAVTWACVSLYRAYHRYDIDRKYDYAMQQCEKYGGLKGDVPVVTEGVYDHRRNTASKGILRRAAIFINRGLEYVEFGEGVVHLSFLEHFEWSGPYYKSANTPYPYYRVFVASSGNPLCEPYEKMAAKDSTIVEEAGLASTQCLAVEGFDDPAQLKAPYELLVSDQVVDEGTPVEWNNVQIVDRQSGVVAASFNTFSHCFTKQKRNRSEGFGYCSGIYGNPKVRPKCPAEYAKDSRVIEEFEFSAFKFER